MGRVETQVEELAGDRVRLRVEVPSTHVRHAVDHAASDLAAAADASFSFTATVAVQPKVDVADWTKLEVPAAEAEVPEEIVSAELEALRRTVAELVPVARAARE